jgi:hypothetical protein
MATCAHDRRPHPELILLFTAVVVLTLLLWRSHVEIARAKAKQKAAVKTARSVQVGLITELKTAVPRAPRTA